MIYIFCILFYFVGLLLYSKLKVGVRSFLENQHHAVQYLQGIIWSQLHLHMMQMYGLQSVWGTLVKTSGIKRIISETESGTKSNFFPRSLRIADNCWGILHFRKTNNNLFNCWPSKGQNIQLSQLVEDGLLLYVEEAFMNFMK